MIADTRDTSTESGCEIALVDKIGLEIQREKQHLSDLHEQQRAIYMEISATKTILPQLEISYAEELEVFTLQYMREKFGITDRHDANNSYLIFDKTARFVKVYRRNQEFQYLDDMENILRKEKLYGHSASSWFSRGREFYNLVLREQLKILSWTFDDDGNITGANW